MSGGGFGSARDDKERLWYTLVVLSNLLVTYHVVKAEAAETLYKWFWCSLILSPP